MEMNDKLYLISFKTEGVEQILKSNDDGDEGGEDKDEDKGDNGLEEDDLLEEDTSGGDGNIETPGGAAGPSSNLNKVNKNQDQGSNKSKTKSSSLIRNLSKIFQTQECDYEHEESAADCLNLLHAMELDDKFESEEDLGEEEGMVLEEEMVNLPEDWVFNLQQEGAQVQEGSGDAQVAKESRVPITTDPPAPAPAKGKKARKELAWGPVMAIRRSKRNMNDDRPVMEKAQEFKKKWSPDQHKGKKLFPPKVFDKSALVCVANTVGLKFSGRSLAIESCLDNMENMEKVRGSSFSKSPFPSLVPLAT